MHDCQKITLKDKVANTIRKFNLINPGDKIVLGVSGGPDSMCMLDILLKLQKENNFIFTNCQEGRSKMAKNCQKGTSPVAKNCQNATSLLANFLVVAHVNHLIREEAKDDEQYVKEYCEKNGIKFYAKSIDVMSLANNKKIGVEEAGRKARYEFFDEVLKETGANKIAIAHNKNDKVETIIMHLFRGCGVNGLIGIEPKRGKYIRPLIECDRQEIERYCEEHGLNPRIDKTNFENEYTRNKIRNIVIPYIKKEFNPNIIDTFDRLSKLASDEQNYIDEQVREAYGNMLLSVIKDPINDEKIKEIVLDLKEFNLQKNVIKSRIILYTITNIIGSSDSIGLINVEDIIRLCKNNIGNKYLTPNKNIKILVKDKKIFFTSML